MQIFTIFIKTLAMLQRSVSLYLLVVCCYVHTMEADKNAEPGWLRATAHLEHREIVHRYAWVLSTKMISLLSPLLRILTSILKLIL